VRYGTFVQPRPLSCSWASEGEPGPPGFFNLTFYVTFLAKKVVFLISRKKNIISSSLSPLEKFVWLEKSANGIL